ncbi:YehS family protein [Chitinimonas naiadis]
MITNDVLRSIRYLLNITDGKVADIIKLTGFESDRADIIDYLRKDEEEGYRDCPEEVLAHFLDGLILFKRGRDENRPLQPITLPLYNNLVLKKLRVAFELKEDDMLSILDQAGFRVSRPELSALFRSPDHKNYRRCGDQFLRNFLKGLTLRLRG